MPKGLTVEWGKETGGPVMVPDARDQKWYEIAEQTSNETDPAKLQVLVAQLCTALDDRMRPYAPQSRVA